MSRAPATPADAGLWQRVDAWLLRGFLLTGFFIWLAENIGTFFGAWTSVHVGKWSSWSLLVIMTFTIVANLKHIEARIHVPE